MTPAATLTREGSDMTMRGPGRAGAEPYLAARVLDALLRENYGGLAARMTCTKDGVQLVLPSGRPVRLTPGRLFQDFVVASWESLTLEEVLGTLAAIAEPADTGGVAAFAGECRAALRAYELHEPLRESVLARLRGEAMPGAPGRAEARGRSKVSGRPTGPGRSGNSGSVEVPGRPGRDTLVYETLAAFLDHPVYPTSRARPGLSDAEVVAYAPEFAPSFALRWVAVPAERVVSSAGPAGLPAWWPEGDGASVPFPVHPLTLPAVRDLPGVVVHDGPELVVRPTLSMRTVEIDARTHLKLPLVTSTLGARNRRSIKPGTLEDGARAERLLREVLRGEPDLGVLVAGEQTYAHAGHEHLAWMVRSLPPGEIVSVAALLAPSPEPAGGPRVLDDLAARFHGGDVAALLTEYLRLLFAWNVRLFVGYGIALEAHQQNLALVFGDGGTRLLVKDDDGLLASPTACAPRASPCPTSPTAGS